VNWPQWGQRQTETKRIDPEDVRISAKKCSSGGSGGPLFNQNGRGVGVTYTVVKGFCGSNFGISIRFAQLLVSP
jgi:hypothetical protein